MKAGTNRRSTRVVSARTAHAWVPNWKWYLYLFHGSPAVRHAQDNIHCFSLFLQCLWTHAWVRIQFLWADVPQSAALCPPALQPFGAMLGLMPTPRFAVRMVRLFHFCSDQRSSLCMNNERFSAVWKCEKKSFICSSRFCFSSQFSNNCTETFFNAWL